MSQRTAQHRHPSVTDRKQRTPFLGWGHMAAIAMAALGFNAGCEDEPGPACTPGETRLCSGLGRCSGVQSCVAEGTGFEEACDCSSPLPDGFGEERPAEPTAAVVGRTCQQDAECGEGLTCLTSDDDTAFFGGGVANGYCTRSCTNLDECTGIDPIAECVLNGSGDTGFCIRTCASRTPPPTENKCLGRLDLVCRSVAFLRIENPGFERQRGWCYPQCNSDDECGGRFCNLETGVCTDTAATGKAIGERCAESSECAGNICLGISDDEAERLCSAPCRLGIPTSPSGCGYSLNTPSRDSSCIGPQIQSLFGNEGGGDMGYCLELCDVDADCAQNAEFGWTCRLDVPFEPRTGRAGVCFLAQDSDDAGAADASPALQTPATGDSGILDSGTPQATSGPDASNTVDANGG